MAVADSPVTPAIVDSVPASKSAESNFLASETTDREAIVGEALTDLEAIMGDLEAVIGEAFTDLEAIIGEALTDIEAGIGDAVNDVEAVVGILEAVKGEALGVVSMLLAVLLSLRKLGIRRVRLSSNWSISDSKSNSSCVPRL